MDAGDGAGARPAGEALLDALERGELRVAERGPDGRWRVQAWIKQAILELFRASPVVSVGAAPEEPAAFRDKRPFADTRRFAPEDGVRVVPGGSAVRRGAFLGEGVVVMPPAYVNVGAWVGPGTMIDSHALVGSCAQIGARVHLSAAAQIGGVLEPPGARPVIVEDEVFVGGACGLYEGVCVREGAVLGAGVVLTGTSRIFDLVEERVLQGTPEAPLEVPARAVIVPGTRRAAGAFAAREGLGLQTALLVKIRDERTDRRAALEDALR
jgi:2,3,4,5-tetrahydropyridine-2-carboxylate N-succinyltransferase